MLYFPNSTTKKDASAQLGRWMRQIEKLKIKLFELGYKPRKKKLSPDQVRY